MADCNSYREEIEDADGFGGLSNEARAHAAMCASCGLFTSERESLRLLVRGLNRVEAPDDFEFRLRARINASGGSGGKFDFIRQRLTPGLAWATAVCILVVSASLYVLQERRRGFEAPNQTLSRNDSETEKKEVASAGKPAVTIPAIGNVVETEAPRVTISSKRKNDDPRRIASRPSSRKSLLKEQGLSASQGGSSDFGVGVAKVLRLQKIPLNSSSEPLRFVVTDEQGNARPVPMRAVSFGSQELIAGARAHVVSNEKGGVW